MYVAPGYAETYGTGDDVCHLSNAGNDLTVTTTSKLARCRSPGMPFLLHKDNRVQPPMAPQWIPAIWQYQRVGRPMFQSLGGALTCRLTYPSCLHTSNRSLYPTTSAHPVYVLIFHLEMLKHSGTLRVLTTYSSSCFALPILPKGQH